MKRYLEVIKLMNNMSMNNKKNFKMKKKALKLMLIRKN